MIDPTRRRPLGTTGLRVTGICVGTSPLASMPDLYGYEVSDATAEATIEAVLAGPLNFLDTSNNYGDGRAEQRIGAVLRRRGGLPPDAVLATKVDADPVTGDFSGRRVRQSVAESLDRLGLDRVQLMYLHDPEFYLTFEQAMADDGPVPALLDLRDQGVLQHLGIAGGKVELMSQLVETGLFEVVLNHTRYTLLDRASEPLIADAHAHGVAFVNAAPYGGGILAKGPDRQPRYGYRDTTEDVRETVRTMRRRCDAYGVPLAAAALQFSLRDRRITTTIVGFSEPGRVRETLDLAAVAIPDELWTELEALAPPATRWQT
jgi:D-threo-aldose 1-dehydrogenase